VTVQGDSGGKANISRADIMRHSEKKKLRTNICLIQNGYRDTAVLIY